MRRGPWLSQALRALATLAGVWLLVNLLPRWLPEDPARIAAGEWATEAEVLALRHEMRLDLPWPRALRASAAGLLKGDLGRSHRHAVPVGTLLARGFPLSFRLASLSILLSAVLAWLLAAGRSPWLRGLQAVAIASPVYVLGPLLLWAVASRVPWFPVAGIPGEGIQAWTGWILPSLALAVPLAGHQARILDPQLALLRGSLGVRWWTASGIPAGLRWRKWLLPAVAGPWLTVLGLQLGGLLGGAVLVETLFALPGLGLCLVDALASRDLPVVQGAVLLGAALFILVQLAVEGLQALLDPRLR